ncbi:MAG: hypothetical protein QF560_04045 [SAR324 cluster bacterium]|uniref:Uncharacterized protein n=1 Tax=marine metagenome TaxID=408172 RepID=A0A382PXP4_9ZZZZ|nr:hypothetical protein [SAR324 cluster bacterium]MDP6245606.1 hypothetical protein [SAR324 cluster bacterium]MDP6465842.1 hypothetical protein [SAR324 cluster bacterium]MDP6638305.1 hypothetical protein [SAR324 cluster bacterium]MDP7137532.1 hypothetical protein [SAR324 cluster bacterium]
MDLGTQEQLRFSDRGLKLPRTLGREGGQEWVKEYIQVKLV